MKLHEHFKTFLEDHVDLNQTRLNLLDNSVDAVKRAIRSSGWTPRIRGFEGQGSWAHRTIIKPQQGEEFDADLLVLVSAVSGWDAKQYVQSLADSLEANSAYTGKVRRHAYCVTIEYAGDRRIDLAPCVQDRVTVGTYEVCNRITNDFEISNPIEYTNWVIERNAVAGGNDLKKVTRLLKYLRDIKGNFTCPSFLFTTLLGKHIYDSDSGSSELVDTPTCLKTIIGRLDDWLQSNPTVPTVRNPKLWSEVQSDVWTDGQYSNFREKISLYRGWIDEAFDETDRDESIGKWQRVFGSNFAAGEAKDAARSAVRDTGALVAGRYLDLVEKVKAIGQAAVPDRLLRLPYIERPKWKPASTRLTVKVAADLLTGRYGSRLGSTASLAPLQSGYWLKFTAVNNVGLPWSSSEYTVKWRVTNTDQAAFDADQLRGDFYKSDEGASRWESLSYRGVHFVEAFVIRRADKRLAGKSDPFYVVIE